MTNLRDRVQDFDEQVSGSTEEMDVDELEAELGINFEDAYINNYLPEVSKRFKPQDIADEAVTPTVDQDDLESTEEKNSDELKAELRIDCEQDANVKAPLPEEPESPEPQDKAEEAATPAAVEKDDLESTEEKESERRMQDVQLQARIRNQFNTFELKYIILYFLILIEQML